MQKTNWQILKTLTAGNFVVEVSFLNIHEPKYSVVIGSAHPEGGVSRFTRPEVTRENGKVTVGHYGMTLARLYDEAMEIVQEHAQLALDRQIAFKINLEEKSLKRESQLGPKVGGGLSKFNEGSKTQREAASGKRNKHEGNLAARRSADQERTHNTKGKGK